ncbi:MAG TPA: KGK domain-containing protein [Allocoleopsis sp.]
MNNDFGMLSDDEVLFVRAGRIVMANPTFKVSEFLDALAQLISEQEPEWSEDQEGWFTDRGTSCEVLRFTSQGWQRGRVRIRLEFCPERPPKLLRESRTPREDVYQQEGYRQDKPQRRSSREDVYRENVYREDVYREDIYRRDPSQRWEEGQTIYPEVDDDF